MRVQPGKLCREAAQIYARGASILNYESCHLGSGYTTCLFEETPQAKCHSVLDALFQDTFQL